MALHYKKLGFLLLCMLFVPATFCSLLDIDLSDIPTTIKILEHSERTRARAARNAAVKYSIAEVHYLTCLALFHLPEGCREIEAEKEAVRDTQRRLFKILTPKAIKALPGHVRTACDKLLETISRAAEIVISRLDRLIAPSRAPEVEYPEEVITLEPVIKLFQQALKVTAREKEECAEEAYPGPAGAGSSAPTAAPLPKPIARRAPEAAAYLIRTIYLRICSYRDDSYSDYLLLATHKDLSRSVYYPALCRGRPATAYDFKLRSDEIDFLDLNYEEIIKVFSTYICEGFPWNELEKYSGSTHFPLLDINNLRKAVIARGTLKGKSSHSTPLPLFPQPKSTALARATSPVKRRADVKLLFTPGRSIIIYVTSIITL